MQADAYLATGARIGLLVLLDLSDKSKGRPTDLAGSVRAIPLERSPVDHLVICAVVPGNQRTPSSIGATARTTGRRVGRGTRAPSEESQLPPAGASGGTRRGSGAPPAA